LKLAETPGERLQRAVYAAAALAGVRATEPEVAKAVGLTRKVIHGLFAGIEPRGDVLRAIADGLETTTPEALLAAREGRSPEVGLDRIANEISELRDAILDRATRRAAAAERRDWATRPDQAPGADDEPDDEPDRRPA
jgi:hypothetical protein